MGVLYIAKEPYSFVLHIFGDCHIRYHQPSLWNAFLKPTPNFFPASQPSCISRDLLGINVTSDLICPI